MLTFTVNMTGVAAADGSFSVQEPTFKSCGAVGTTVYQPNSFEFAIPGSEGEEVSGQGFGLQVGIPDYSGPGRYTVPNNGSLEAVYLGSHQFSLVFATVTVNANGSGIISFSHETDLLGYFDSGTISWICA